MDLKGLTLAKVAAELAAVEPPLDITPTQTTVKRHVDGTLHPTPEYVRRYRIITQRAVEPNDWHELALQRRAAQQIPDTPSQPSATASA
jgi:hypothetical protein